MPTNRRKRTRSRRTSLTPAAWHWLSGATVEAIDEFELTHLEFAHTTAAGGWTTHAS